jgi:hypothetical protein
MNHWSPLAGNDEWVEYKTDDQFYMGYVDKESRIWVDYGVLAFKGQSLYEGEWENNKANGFGILIHPDGNYYKGYFQDDKANGEGTFHYNDGTILQGKFWNDKIYDGQGMETYPDGSKFEGKF